MSGLDGLPQEIRDPEKAVAAMDGPVREISFEPDDPASVQAAQEVVDRLVNEKVGKFGSASIAHEILEAAKESFRISILGSDTS